MTEQQQTQAPTPAEPKKYAAYDKTYLKYVGGVHDSQAKARAAAKAKGVKDIEIREV